MTTRPATLLLYTLHVGNFYGTEKMALATLEGLREYRRVVVAPRSAASPSLLEVARAMRYEVRPFERLGGLVRALLPIFLRHRRIDMISTSATHNTICTWLARLFFVRLRQLNVVHGGGEDRYSYANKHRLNTAPVVLVAVSRFVREKLIAHGVAAAKVVVIDNFLAPSDVASRPARPAFDASRRAARPLDRALVRVAVVSRLDPVKRLDVLFDAVASGRLAGFRIDVYGSGELLADFEAKAAASHGQVVVHGHVPDVSARLVKADLFLHLCPVEPFGLAILEAFVAGVPVIVPDAGGAGELVEPGVSGLAYAAADPEALATCLLAAAALDGARLDALVAAARMALQRRFSAAAGAAAYRVALSRA